MTDAANGTVRVTHRFKAPAERVFDAWLNPESARKWLFTMPTSQVIRCDIEPHVGGKFLIVDRREDGDVEHLGEYQEIARPHRLVFTFAVPKYSSQVTRVTIDIAAQPGGCELTLLHENVLPEWVNATQEGWTMILERLENAIG